MASFGVAQAEFDEPYKVPLLIAESVAGYVAEMLALLVGKQQQTPIKIQAALHGAHNRSREILFASGCGRGFTDFLEIKAVEGYGE